jgi:hypothetical protein
MKTISPLNNTPTIVHITEFPPLNNLLFNFGFNTGQYGDVPTVRVNVKLVNGIGAEQIKIATYDSVYQIQGEGLVLEDHIYDCCLQAIYAMKMFLQFDEIGRSIPQEIFQCPGKEAFENDLVHLAKVLNSFEGKRNFPMEE